jgi:hypothetical protein
LHEKYRPGDAYDPNRIVDPAGKRAAVERLEGIYREQLARERAGRRLGGNLIRPPAGAADAVR